VNPRLSRRNRLAERVGFEGTADLSDPDPGSYVNFTRLGKKIVYMEQATMMISTVTHWGELEVVTGR